MSFMITGVAVTAGTLAARAKDGRAESTSMYPNQLKSKQGKKASTYAETQSSSFPFSECDPANRQHLLSPFTMTVICSCCNGYVALPFKRSGINSYHRQAKILVYLLQLDYPQLRLLTLMKRTYSIVSPATNRDTFSSLLYSEDDFK